MRLSSLIQLAYFKFLLRYRRTALGPLWLLVGPSLFIALVGALFAEIGAADPKVFIPHLAVGLVVWTLITGFIINAATVFQRNRPQIMQEGGSLIPIVIVDVALVVFSFLHQAPIILVVCILFAILPSWDVVFSLVGLFVLVLNGIWAGLVFGILGARYRDLSEVFHAIMRIAFLATPILWIPGDGERGVIMTAFLVFNPFYHYIEIVRAPLLGNPVAGLSIAIVCACTVAGFALAWALLRRFARVVPLWV
ncbi:MAG: ABC transporter permease [Pseudomonadota bacterium]